MRMWGIRRSTYMTSCVGPEGSPNALHLRPRVDDTGILRPCVDDTDFLRPCVDDTGILTLVHYYYKH